MLDREVPTEAASEDLFARIMQRCEQSEPVPVQPHHIPRDPLQKLLGAPLEDLPWKRQLRDVSVYDLSDRFPEQSERIVLQKLHAGGRAPTHTHQGEETTLVLQGGFTDNRGVFEAGDFVLLDSSVEHQPVALHGEDCVTFSILSAPLKLTGPFMRLLNPFIR